MGRPAQVAEDVHRRAPSLTTYGLAGAAASVLIGLLERGTGDFAAPLRVWLGDVTLIGSGHSFLRTFVTDISIFAPTVRHHPPGFLLGLWLLDWLHAQGSGWAIGVVLVGDVMLAVAIAMLLAPRRRSLAVAAIALVAALWPAPDPTALFAGVALLGAALVVWPSRLGAVVGGLLLGGGLLLAYEAVVAVAVAGVALRRRPAHAAIAVVAIVAVLGVVATFGFSWIGGLATRW